MIEYLRKRMGERSSHYGMFGIGFGLVLFLGGFAPFDERITSAMQQLAITVLGVGLVAVFYPEKKPPCGP